jgi:peptide chain release factor
MMLLLQISAAQGPVECQLAVAKALRRLQIEAVDFAVELQVVEHEPGALAGTFRSVLLALEGVRADEFARSWVGTVQWTYPSPYRPTHGRQNWFIGVACFSAPAAIFEREIRFETMRSSGPGGQHVNTTDSAVRATHVSTGISVKVQTERSQHANKRLAVLLIARRLEQRTEETKTEQRADRRMAHHQVARGNPVRVFRGEYFKPSH